LRVISLGILLAVFLAACDQGSKTQNQHNRDEASASLANQVETVETPTLTPTPVVEETAATQDEQTLEGNSEEPTPLPTQEPAVQSAASAPEPTPAPAAPTPVVDRASGGSAQEVLITFYYCQRTVERSDDGGGYCGNTASGIPVHTGSAACPISWMGRSFTIQGEPTGQVYTCEDTGGAVNGNHVDIWFRTNGEGWSWPHKDRGVIIWTN
jgi:3D (Asp-Asp-Asp) domain-containing protein